MKAKVAVWCVVLFASTCGPAWSAIMTVQHGDIEVAISDIVRCVTRGESPTERGLIVKTSDFLLITVESSNTSSNRIYDYTTFRDKAVLTDNNSNNYPKLERFANRNLNISIIEQGKVKGGWVPPSDFDPQPILG
jgi:hypothetical protein